jgi:expansin (peptidoglycan-binding protein)
VLRPLLAPAALVSLVSFVAVVLVACGGDDAPADDGSSGTTTKSGTGHAGSGGALDTPLPVSPKTGIATFYDYSGSGVVACSFDVGADTNITAMNDGEYAKAASCGSCLNVVGPKGSIKVRVVDRCPGCAANHIDLSAQAFAKIAEPKAGRVPITYEVVACDVPSKMSYRFKEGSSKFWTAIQVRDHRVPITKVEYKKNGVYTNMPRSDYNYFIDTKGVGDQPNGISLRVTAADGQVIEETIPNVQAGKLFAGTKQFD